VTGGALRTVVVGDGVVIGVAEDVPDVALGDFDVLLTSRPDPPRPWVCASLDGLHEAVDAAPAAAATLAHVLRASERASVEAGVVVESLAYSMLQHGERFETWLADRGRPPSTRDDAEPVALERAGDALTVRLQRPDVHNAMNAPMRDALCEAFELVSGDDTIVRVDLRGDGPSFCSGGDLTEFGSARDAALAHLIRVERSVGARVHRCAGRVTAWLHGACIGAGIEISAFAGRVVAHDDVRIQLPEVAMGLIPGAGGTVSIPRRIGRHRTAYLALSGAPLDAPTALAWGLVDEVAPDETADRA
jgi:enoyl-CoA hydratase/carnithine racemase